MRQIPSLSGLLKASQRLSGLVWRLAGCRAKDLRKLNLHRIVLDSPVASFNLRLSEILPGTVWAIAEDLVESQKDARHSLKKVTPAPSVANCTSMRLLPVSSQGV